jgi:hypothetical protein
VLPVTISAPSPAGDHRRRGQPRQMKQRHLVDFKVALQRLRLNLREGAKRPTDGVVNPDPGVTDCLIARSSAAASLTSHGTATDSGISFSSAASLSPSRANMAIR